MYFISDLLIPVSNKIKRCFLQWKKGVHTCSKFDGVAVIRTLLKKTKEPVEDLLASNSRYVSFKWERLIFRDSMLITTGSLGSVPKSYVVETSSLLPPKLRVSRRAPPKAPQPSEVEGAGAAHELVPWRQG